jgi:hypothetical protein
MTATETTPKLYKILKKGQSCNGGDMVWSLPKRGKPGDWHEVKGTLMRCENGFHLTDRPLSYRGEGRSAYEVEFDGDISEPRGNEYVARKVRLIRHVPWKELLPVGDGMEDEPKDPGTSPALVLLDHVWKTQGDGMGKSWARLNSAMQVALNLAIEHGIRFDEDDFVYVTKNFRPGYWLNWEKAYSRACALLRAHGENPSAIKAIEKHLNRKPFIVAEKPHIKSSKIRLCEGRRFSWHVKLKTRVNVTVTSFTTLPDGTPAVIACSYKPYDPNESRKIDKRFTITHAAIAEYHNAIRDFAKAQTAIKPEE